MYTNNSFINNRYVFRSLFRLMPETKDLQKFGVYKLYDKNKNVIYVGSSVNLVDRLCGSMKEKKAFYFSIVSPNTIADTYVMEYYLINKFKPHLNKTGLSDDNLSFDINCKYDETEIIDFGVREITRKINDNLYSYFACADKNAYSLWCFFKNKNESETIDCIPENLFNFAENINK